MAEKRMFTQKIIDSDAFLDMPMSTQALYFHLNMRADDDGFVNNPKRIQRTIGASEDDLKLLIAKRFIIGFESGVIVIKHWRMHNTLRKDRYNPTQYQEELAMLNVKGNNAYTERFEGADEVKTLPVATSRQPNGNHSATQYSEVENSIEEDSIEKKSKRETTHTLFKRLLPEYILSEALVSKLTEWITYKTERKEPYKEQGMKALLRQVENNAMRFGDAAVCYLIEDSMSNGWKGIIFDRLKNPNTRTSYQKQTKADELNDFYQMAQQFGEG